MHLGERRALVAQAAALMLGYADRTGLRPPRRAKRYLWTDSFAVCNFLGLARTTGEDRYRELAHALVDQVHHTLGRHRDDDPRRGWISGLSEAAGEAHPTRGGLRIGKPLPERKAGEREDPQLEWDRDGQYFHYLTKWVHALHLMAHAEQDPRAELWSRELLQVAHRSFVSRKGAAPTMNWKMSIDLTRTLVPSSGLQDPLDGLLTAVELRSPVSGVTLDAEIATFRGIVAATNFATEDPLALGGLLVDVYRVEQLGRAPAASRNLGVPPPPTSSTSLNVAASLDRNLARDLMRAALAGLERWAFRRDLDRPAATRLPFRELGLVIGLRAIDLMRAELGRRFARASEEHVLLDALSPYVALGDKLTGFWLDPESRLSPTWTEHQDINDVMLATALLPNEYLDVVGHPLGDQSAT